MKKATIWFFYLIGLIVFSSFIHELWHFAFCKGEFVAGFGVVRKSLLYGGLTWCKGSNYGGEIVPSLLEVGIIIGGIYLKLT